MRLARIRRRKALLYGVSCLTIVALAIGFLGLNKGSAQIAGPYGSRPSEVNLEGAYRLPMVYVEKMNAAVVGKEISGVFTAWNRDTDALSNLQYRLEVYGDFRGEASADPKVLFYQSEAKDVSMLLPEERTSMNFQEMLPDLPSGNYAVRVQLLYGKSKHLGWATSRLTIGSPNSEFITMHPVSIGLPEFKGEEVGPLTGPNVDGESIFQVKLRAQNVLGKAQTLTPSISLAEFDRARGVSNAIEYKPISVPEGSSDITLDLVAPTKAGVYVAEAVLKNEQGKTVSSLGQFRFVVRGVAANVISVRPLHFASKKGEAAFVRIDHVGSPDAETRTTGSLEVTLRDAGGIVGTAFVPEIPLSDAIVGGMAKIVLSRNLKVSPTILVRILDRDGKELSVSENPIALSSSQLASLSIKSTTTLWLQWNTLPAAATKIALFVIGALLLGVLALLLKKSLPQVMHLHQRSALAVLAAFLFFNVQPAFAWGSTNNGIEVASPRTLQENEAYLTNQDPANIANYRQYWGPIYGRPIVELFVNQPIHNQQYDCRGPIPLDIRIEYAACNNVPAGGRVIARFDANGGLQSSLLGTNADWRKVFEQVYVRSPNFQPPTSAIYTQTYSTNVFLTGLNPSATQTTLQVVVKHNAFIDGSHPLPDDTIDPNEHYFVRRFSQAFNIWLRCLIPSVDVLVTKTASVQQITPGGSFQYTITAQNLGPGTAQNVVITDQITSGINVTNVPQGCSFNGNTRVLTCNVGTMQPNTSQNFTFTVSLPQDASCPAVLQNTAVIQTSSTDTNQGNNQSTVNVQVNCANADVQISKNGPQSVNRGDQIAYVLIAQNNGPATAAAVTVVDQIPSPTLTFVPGQSDSRCSQQGNAISCNLGSMASGAQTSIALTFQTSQQTQCGPVTNIATITTSSPDNNSGNNTASFQTQVVCPTTVDVGVVKAASVQQVTPGGSWVYTITVQNFGSGPADNVVLTDPIPTGVAVTNVPAGCSMNGNQLTCNIGTLQAGQTRQFSVPVTLSGGCACCPSTITNTATVQTSSSDTNSGNNQSTVQVQVVCPTVDVGIVKTASVQTVQPGQSWSYTLTVQNFGAAPAQNVVITDTLPAMVTATNLPAGCTLNGNQITCNAGTLDAAGGQNAVKAFTFTATLSGTCGCPSTITNTATVQTSSADSNPGNNQSTVQVQVTCPTNVDVGITKTANVQTIIPGTPWTYTLTVQNFGTAPAQNVSITDQIPAGVTVNSVSSGCTVNGNQVTCSAGTLDQAGGQNAVKTFTVNVSIPACPCQCPNTILNTATVTTTSADSNPQNNSASITLPVACAGAGADVQISKSGPVSINRGDQISYAIIGKNNGPGDATVVTVTDPVPPGLTFVSGSPSSPECTQQGSNVVCTLGTLTNGQQKALNLTFQTSAQTQCGPVINIATIATTTGGDNPGNNSASFQTQVNCPGQVIADLSVTKTGAQTAVRGAEIVSYTITVRNNGPATATGVTLRDPVPSGLTFQSNTGPVTCNLGNDNVVNCNLGNMPANDQKTIVLNFTSPFTGSCSPITVQNTATVTSQTPDNNAGNNNASASTTLTCPTTSFSITKTGPSVVTRGNLITYSVTVTNTGQGAATNVVITDPIPTLSQGNPTFASGNSDASCGQQGSSVVCNIGTMNPGASRTVAIAFNIPTVSSCSSATMNNTATVKSDQTPGGVQSQNVITTVNCPTGNNADLSVDKTGPSSVRRGDYITYNVTVRNSGPDTATNVVLSDQIPSLIQGTLSYQSSDSRCSQQGSTIVCNLGTITNGSSTNVTISFFVPNTTSCFRTSMNNLAYARSDQNDSNGAQSQTVITNVDCQGSNYIDIRYRDYYAYDYRYDTYRRDDRVDSVRFTKTADRAEVLPGDIIGYTLTLTNDSSRNISATVEDDYPSQYSSIDSAGGGSVSARSIQWQVNIPAHNAVTLRYTLRVPRSVRSGVVLVNNATARGSFLGSPLYASARVQVLGQLPQTGFSFAGSVAKLRNFLTPWEDVEEAKAQNNVSESTDSSGMTGTIIWTLLVLAGLGGGVIVGRKFIH